MNFTDAVVSFFKKYAVFSGRSSRSEYWYPFLFVNMVGFGLGFMEGILGIFPYHGESVLAILFNLGIIIPTCAVSVRRLHDVNLSGWWFLLVFTIIGIIPVLYWFCKEGDGGDNKFGPNPLSHEQDSSNKLTIES